jgi:hypothetical protein
VPMPIKKRSIMPLPFSVVATRSRGQPGAKACAGPT